MRLGRPRRRRLVRARVASARLELYAAVCRRCGYKETTLRSGGESGLGKLALETDDDEPRDPLYTCEPCHRVSFVHRRARTGEELALELAELEAVVGAHGKDDPRGRLAERRRAQRAKDRPAQDPRPARCAHCRGQAVKLIAVSELRVSAPRCPACGNESLELLLRGFGGD